MSKRFQGKDLVARTSIAANHLSGIPLNLNDELPFEVQGFVDEAMGALDKVIDACELDCLERKVKEHKENIDTLTRGIQKAQDRIEELRHGAAVESR